MIFPLHRLHTVARESILQVLVFTAMTLVILSLFSRHSVAATDWSTITLKDSVATSGFASGLAVSSNGRYVYLADDDGDGKPDVTDNCPLTANADQLDTDLDGLGDVCDTDDDGDGKPDITDNCPLTANADQLDTDLDGLGDVCDRDDDDDGEPDITDNCPLIANADQRDTDDDNIGNLCDTKPVPTSPLGLLLFCGFIMLVVGATKLSKVAEKSSLV